MYRIIGLTPQAPDVVPTAADDVEHVEAGAPVEITPAMLEAGEEAIWGLIGGYDLGGHFSASRLAKEVYLAMKRAS